MRDERSGVPHGSVLSPVLYTLYTSDLQYPRQPGTLLATYSDDIAFIANSPFRFEASRKSKIFLDLHSEWTKMYNISINGNKSQHCNFSPRHKTPPRIELKDSSTLIKLQRGVKSADLNAKITEQAKT